MKVLSVLIALILALGLTLTAAAPVAAVVAVDVWVCADEGDDHLGDGSQGNPYATIQHGVNMVAEGGTVHVKHGIYGEHVSIANKSLTLRSTQGAAATTITEIVNIDLDGGQTVVFGGAEDAGFTVDRGNPVPDSGILLSAHNGAEVTISHNIITGADVGIRSETAFTIAGGSTVVIEDNRIVANDGHGIYLGWISDDSTVLIDSNQITDNGGAGIYIGCIGDALMTVTITGNTITENDGHGIYVSEVLDSTLIVEDNMIAENGRFGISLDLIDYSTVVIDQNVVGAWEEWKGNDDGGINIGSVLSNSSLQITGNHANENCANYFGIQINIVDGSTVNIEDNETNGNVEGIIVHSVRAGGALYVVGNTIAENWFGLTLWGVVDGTAVILGNWIEDSEQLGIRIGHLDNSTPRINFNNFLGNEEWGLHNSSENEVEATHNWWGDASGPSGQAPGEGDAVSENVLYDPWLGAAMTDQPMGCTADRGYGVDARAETDNVSAEATGGDDTTTVTVAEYVGNPTGVGPGLEAGPFYFDVHVGGTLPSRLVVTVDCDGDCTGIVLRWFDVEDWHDVDPVSYTNGTIVATLSDTSSPTIAQLTGTPFVAGEPHSPVVGGTAEPVSRLALLAPWLVLGAAIIAGAAVFVKRRQSQS